MTVLVHALDTPAGDAAVNVGITEARLRGLALHLATYVRVNAESANPGTSRAQAEERLTALADRARLAGVSDVGTHVSLGIEGAAATVLDLAATLEAELLVIGVRRRSRVGKLVLGSVSQDLLLGADCAVLAVKEPDEP